MIKSLTYLLLLIVHSQLVDFEELPGMGFRNCTGMKFENCEAKCGMDETCFGYTKFRKHCLIYNCPGTNVVKSKFGVSWLKKDDFLESDNCTDKHWDFLKHVDVNQFKQVKLESGSCEIVRNMAGGQFKRDDNFTCGLSTCLKWCVANTACLVAMYKPGSCVILAHPEITDTVKSEFEMFNKEWQAFQKYPQYRLPYYSQQCAELTKPNCVGKCKWGFGKPAYNRPIYGGFEGKWCGRVKC